jgi:hypothetical protein
MRKFKSAYFSMSTKKVFFRTKGAFSWKRARERKKRNLFPLLLFYAKMLFPLFLIILIFLSAAAGVFVHKRERAQSS